MPTKKPQPLDLEDLKKDIEVLKLRIENIENWLTKFVLMNGGNVNFDTEE